MWGVALQPEVLRKLDASNGDGETKEHTERWRASVRAKVAPVQSYQAPIREPNRPLSGVGEEHRADLDALCCKKFVGGPYAAACESVSQH